jgi:hypothetical protein
MFPQNGHHPLEFLTVSDWIYRRMTGDSGKCNRRMVDYYRNIVNELGYDAKLHITKTIGSGSKDFPPDTLSLKKGTHYNDDTLARVREIRPRLRPEFQRLSDEDLLIQDMFIVARKPIRNAGGK